MLSMYSVYIRIYVVMFYSSVHYAATYVFITVFVRMLDTLQYIIMNILETPIICTYFTLLSSTVLIVV